MRRVTTSVDGGKSMKMRWFGNAFIFGVVAVAAATGVASARDLLVLSENVPSGLDIEGPSVVIPTSQTGMVNLLDPLVYQQVRGVNEDGVAILDYTSFEGRLIESWTYDPQSMKWTLRLRKDVVGCNGERWNADDVLYNFARAKSLSGSVPVGWFAGSVSSIKGFTPALFGARAAAQKAKKEGEPPPENDARNLGDEILKVDDYTVAFTQSSPNKLFLPVLTIFSLLQYDKEAMEEHATADDPYSHQYADRTDAPGFGPYCLERWEKNKEFIIRANPNYYRGEASIERVVYRKVPNSSSRVLALRAGQADLIEHLSPREFDSLRGIAGIKVAGAFGNENLAIHLNYKVPPFDNKKVREAIAHAIPYEWIEKNGYFGAARRWKGQIPSTFIDYHEPALQFDYDLEKAAQLLIEAGYPNGQGLDKYEDVMRLYYIAERESVLGPMAIQIAGSLQKIGMNITLEPLPQTQYSDRESVKKDMPFGLQDQKKAIVPDAVFTMLLYFVSARNGGLVNVTNYDNEDFEGLYRTALVEADPRKRTELAAEAQEMLQSDLAWVPVVEWKTQWAFREELKGITRHPDNTLRFHDLRFE